MTEPISSWRGTCSSRSASELAIVKRQSRPRWTNAVGIDSSVLVTRASASTEAVVSYAAPISRPASPSSPAMARPRAATQRCSPLGGTMRYSATYSPQVAIACSSAALTCGRSSGCRASLKASMVPPNCSRVIPKTASSRSSQRSSPVRRSQSKAPIPAASTASCHMTCSTSGPAGPPASWAFTGTSHHLGDSEARCGDRTPGGVSGWARAAQTRSRVPRSRMAAAARRTMAANILIPRSVR